MKIQTLHREVFHYNLKVLNLKQRGTDAMGAGGDVAQTMQSSVHISTVFPQESCKDEVSSVNSVKNSATEPIEKGRIFTAEGISKTQAG